MSVVFAASEILIESPDSFSCPWIKAVALRLCRTLKLSTSDLFQNLSGKLCRTEPELAADDGCAHFFSQNDLLAM
jgi:hypothetical protein